MDQPRARKQAPAPGLLRSISPGSQQPPDGVDQQQPNPANPRPRQALSRRIPAARPTQACAPANGGAPSRVSPTSRRPGRSRGRSATPSGRDGGIDAQGGPQPAAAPFPDRASRAGPLISRRARGVTTTATWEIWGKLPEGRGTGKSWLKTPGTQGSAEWGGGLFAALSPSTEMGEEDAPRALARQYLAPRWAARPTEPLSKKYTTFHPFSVRSSLGHLALLPICTLMQVPSPRVERRHLASRPRTVAPSRFHSFFPSLQRGLVFPRDGDAPQFRRRARGDGGHSVAAAPALRGLLQRARSEIRPRRG